MRLAGIIIATVGAYGVNGNPFDVWVAFIAGVVGVVLRHFRFPVAPIVIGEQVKAGTPEVAMYGFAVFYALCLILNWWFYLRPNAYVKNP